MTCCACVLLFLMDASSLATGLHASLHACAPEHGYHVTADDMQLGLAALATAGLIVVESHHVFCA
jgi:hypothetical protein